MKSPSEHGENSNYRNLILSWVIAGAVGAIAGYLAGSRELRQRLRAKATETFKNLGSKDTGRPRDARAEKIRPR